MDDVIAAFAGFLVAVMMLYAAHGALLLWVFAAAIPIAILYVAQDSRRRRKNSR